MKPETEKAIELARYLETTHITSDTRAAEAIDDLVDAVLDLHGEVDRLKKALVESPVAAEIMKQLPNAMRLRTNETDELRAALFEACEIADENNTGNASSDDRRKAFERITELRNLAKK